MEGKMLETLEEARRKSIGSQHPVYAFSNGDEIRYYLSHEAKIQRPFLETEGFWVAAIFEDGHLVEA